MKEKETWLLACVHYITFMTYEVNCGMLVNIALKCRFIVQPGLCRDCFRHLLSLQMCVPVTL